MMDHIMYLLNAITQLVLTLFLWNQVGKPRYPFPAVLAVFFGLIAGLYWIFSIALQTTLGDLIYTLLRNAAMFGVLFFAYKDSLLHKLLMYSELLAISFFGSLMEIPVLEYIFKTDYENLNRANAMQSAGMMLWSDGAFVMILLLIALHHHKSTFFRRYLRHFGIMILFMVLHAVFLCLYYSDENSLDSYQNSFIQLVFQFIIIVLNIVQFYAIHENYKHFLAEEELRHMHADIQYTYRYYRMADEKLSEISRLRHDLHNQMQTIRVLLEDGGESTAEAHKMLDQLQDKLSDCKTVRFCENPIINAVLTAKMNEPQSECIETDIELQDCDALPFDNYDICSLFANLYDNAAEACRKMKNSRKRFIEIRSGIKGQFFIIKVRNSVDSQLILDKNGLPKTNKSEPGHGLGTKIIQSIAQKYHGSMRIEQDSDILTVVVALQIK